MQPKILFKEGVDAYGVHPAVFRFLQMAAHTYAMFEAKMVVTSLVDGKHSARSFHYRGLAGDLRTRDLSPSDKKTILYEMKRKIINHFPQTHPYIDIVLEETHIHFEFDERRAQAALLGVEWN